MSVRPGDSGDNPTGIAGHPLKSSPPEARCRGNSTKGAAAQRPSRRYRHLKFTSRDARALSQGQNLGWGWLNLDEHARESARVRVLPIELSFLIGFRTACRSSSFFESELNRVEFAPRFVYKYCKQPC
jgi:hypothetical protein